MDSKTARQEAAEQVRAGFADEVRSALEAHAFRRLDDVVEVHFRHTAHTRGFGQRASCVTEDSVFWRDLPELDDSLDTLAAHLRPLAGEVLRVDMATGVTEMLGGTQ
ncbi:hypothetical protein AB0N09_28130 [Streptomyces erythrochromogenes]|uniref:hypothetical protein n=1 Tax=Streptomyces erythrochromogenes TaxID=285574 RepID=UPI003420941E